MVKCKRHELHSLSIYMSSPATGPEGISNYVHAFKNYINNTQSIKVEELPSAFENSGENYKNFLMYRNKSS